MDHKKKLRAKFLDLLSEKYQAGGASEKELAVLSNKFDDVLKSFKDAIANQIITKIPPEVAISNLEQEIKKILDCNGASAKALTEELKSLTHIVSQSKEVQDRVAKWYDNPEVSIKGPVEAVIKDVVKVEKDDGTMISIVTALFGALMQGLARLAQGTFKIMPIADAYTTPQYVMIVDPATGRPVRPDDIGKPPVPGSGYGTAIAASGGPTHVGSRGADELNDGSQTVATAGTAVQLSGDTDCYSVTIQAHPDNDGEVVVGGPNVVAATASRRGLSLFNSQWATFKVSNLNQLWIDSTADGDKVNYFYER